MPSLSWEMITLKLRNPFAVSYGVSDTRNAFWIRLKDDEGWGEGTIPPYYRVDPSAMTGCWETAAKSDQPLPDYLADIEPWIPEGPAPAQCALELALIDRIGKRRNKPLWKLLDLPRPAHKPTAFTLSIDTPEKMAGMAKQVAKYPLIKIKLGSDDGDEARVRAVREARPDAHLIIDANAGWTPEQALANLKWLETCRIELIEQPVAKDQHEAMGRVQKNTPIPIVGDESVQTYDDIERLGAAGVRGVNLKLMKIGGVIPTLKMLERARELKMKVMLGCMIETSIGITAMAHFSGAADWLDLDAPLLVSNDPFDGVTFDETARISVPERPGIGVIKRAM